MYCIKCGVKLAQGEKRCPLCNLRVYHPDIELEEGESLYPKGKYPEEAKKTRFWQIVVTAFFVLTTAAAACIIAL